MKILAIEYERKVGDETIRVQAEVTGDETPEQAYFGVRDWVSDRVKETETHEQQRVAQQEEEQRKAEEAAKREELKTKAAQTLAELKASGFNEEDIAAIVAAQAAVAASEAAPEPQNSSLPGQETTEL